ncbi:MAG: hypothetical protein OEU86_01245 [Gammaproteobacteria bacterium]|nr:hypothetical protein [Gammaproteobacteria bacterium]
METYIVTLLAKTGHEDQVAQFYQDMEPLLKEAKGFRGRKIFQSRPGTMAAAVHKLYPPEELSGNSHPEHDDKGVMFVMMEEWDSIEDRMQFSRSVAGDRQKELIPMLLPNHSHEFYKDVTPASD